MTEREYRAAEGVNQSTLKELRRSPAHYKWALTHPPEDTAALRLGRAAHAAILTPTAYKRDFATAPADNRNTKAYREFSASAPEGVTVLLPSEAEKVREMVKAYRSAPEARQLLRHTRREVPVFWRDADTGILCKGRFDALSSTAVIDIKTTRDASTRAFQREAMRYGYHIQAAHYLAAAEATKGRRFDWYFLLIEKDPPHAVHILKASPGFIDAGMLERLQLMATLKRCMDADQWPGYTASRLDAPSWSSFDPTDEEEEDF